VAGTRVAIAAIVVRHDAIALALMLGMRAAEEILRLREPPLGATAASD
jgi:hypothetical protein